MPAIALRLTRTDSGAQYDVSSRARRLKLLFERRPTSGHVFLPKRGRILRARTMQRHPRKDGESPSRKLAPEVGSARVDCAARFQSRRRTGTSWDPSRQIHMLRPQVKRKAGCSCFGIESDSRAVIDILVRKLPSAGRSAPNKHPYLLIFIRNGLPRAAPPGGSLTVKGSSWPSCKGAMGCQNFSSCLHWTLSGYFPTANLPEDLPRKLNCRLSNPTEVADPAANPLRRASAL